MNALFYFRQSGFREHHSCQTALIKIIDDWLSASNENKIAGSLFLDFSKALDLVDHSLLILKLKLYNIGTSWFSPYVDTRFQQTHYAGTISDKKEMISGVPQWSVLGLILPELCKWSTPLTYSLTSTCADIFADDTTIGTSSHFIDTLVETVTTDLHHVLSWCNSNNMSLNVSKTKLMYFSSRHKQQILGNCDHDISICDSKIKISSVEKLLGVTISNTLCWDAHIDQLIKKCNSYLFLLSRINVFNLDGTEYCFTTLTFYLILISVVLSGVTVVLHWKRKFQESNLRLWFLYTILRTI